MDIISHLPEAILHEILSYLPVNDAVRTCVLSKKWLQIKAREPVRYFNELEFYRNGLGQIEEGYREARKKLFINYVDSQLECFFQHNVGPLIKFHLTIASYDPEHDSGRVDFWLKRVMKGLQYFHLKVCGPKVEYSVPHFGLDSETLTLLILVQCNLDACRNIKLPKLKKLYLRYVDLDEDFITRLTFGCPLLEELRINHCRKLTSLRVTSLPQLERVVLAYCSDLRYVAIQSPNLVDCMYAAFRRKPCELAFQASNLFLSAAEVTRAWLQQQVSRCEQLTMVNISGLEDIKISSRNLRKLNISHCKNMKKVPEIDCPNLCMLVYVQNRLPFHCVNNLQLCKISLDFCLKGGQLSTIWLDHLKDFLGNFSSDKELIKQVIISDHSSEDVIILEGLFECMLPVLHDIADLKPNPGVSITTSSNSGVLFILLKEMLGCCPKASYKTLNVISASTKNSSFSRGIYDELSRTKAEAEVDCCRYQVKKCWRHYLSNVKMDSSGNSFPAVLRSYQSETYQISRIMLEWAGE